jgi:hypothetical protein
MASWDGDNHQGKVRPFPSTSERADELLRARSRTRPTPLPVPPLPPTYDAAAPDIPLLPVGYPVPPRRRRPIDPRPSARDLARRDWFVTGLVLGFVGGVLCMTLMVWVILLFG